MSARLTRSIASLAVAAAAGACGPGFYEVPIETPIGATLDVSAFDRVLVAGFISGGTDDVDANLETTRLLRSQLRNQSGLEVIDADVLALTQLAARNLVASGAETLPAAVVAGGEPDIDDEDDIEPYETFFANVEYWRALGEEFQNPLIVTGSIVFAPYTRSGMVQTDREVFDAFGRRTVVPQREFIEQRGFILRPRFVFIDGRTGATMHSETFREEVLYSVNQTTPALSSYFELMDRLLPTFLNTLSSQSVRGTRILLR
jgi:hypothetical protein